jgi:hypothetical protein
MKTKEEIIAELKVEYPTLKTGDDERGYSEMDSVEYEATIETWANNLYADVLADEAKAKAATDKAALLARLGITEDEAALLLGGN